MTMSNMKFKDQFRSTLVHDGYRQSIDLFMTQLNNNGEFEGICYDLVNKALMEHPYNDDEDSSDDSMTFNSTSLRTAEMKALDFDSMAAYYLYCRWIRRTYLMIDQRDEVTKFIEHLQQPVENDTWKYVMHIAFVHIMLKTDMSAFDQF